MYPILVTHYSLQIPDIVITRIYSYGLRCELEGFHTEVLVLYQLFNVIVTLLH